MFIEAAFILINSMTADTMEYAEWKTGQRNEGVIASARTRITKFASSVAGVLASAALVYTKYQPNVQQTVETQKSCHYLVSIIPGRILLIGVILMPFTQKCVGISSYGRRQCFLDKSDRRIRSGSD